MQDCNLLCQRINQSPVIMTSVMDIILNTPLKILSTQSTQQEFFSTSDTEERLKIAYDALAPYYSMHLESAWPRSFRQKSNEKSAKYRSAGNTMFSKSKLREALRLYTEAIMWAEPGSEDLAMAFANRSAAHFDQGSYKSSIDDIQYALSSGAYPKKLLYKLFLRKGFSLKELRMTKEAVVAFDEALKLVDESGLDETKVTEVRQMIIESRANVDVVEDSVENSSKVLFKDTEMLASVDNPHVDIPEFAENLRVKFNERVGRHVVTDQDINAGDIIAVEEAAVWRLLPSPQLKRICCQCLLESQCPVPCTRQDILNIRIRRRQLSLEQLNGNPL